MIDARIVIPETHNRWDNDRENDGSATEALPRPTTRRGKRLERRNRAPVTGPDLRLGGGLGATVLGAADGGSAPDCPIGNQSAPP